MNTSRVMNILEWIFFCLSLVVKYGPDLLKALRQKYRDVEKGALTLAIGTGTMMASKDKARDFKRGARDLLLIKNGALPGDDKLAEVTEEIWKRENGRLAIPRPGPARRLSGDKVIACKRALRGLVDGGHA